MKNVGTAGRLILAIAILAFGIQHLLYASTGSGLGPPWTPVNHALGYVVGIVFLAAAVCLVAGKQVRCAALVLGTVIFLRAVVYYAPMLANAPRKPGLWTGAFELLAMSGASLILTALFTPKDAGRTGNSAGVQFQVGRFFFAASLVVFGIQHLMYGPFVASLIPSWIPGRLFWAYFVGVAFIATALAIASDKLAPLATTLLGTMFLLWVLILHAPRVVRALHNENEWTSMLVALAMSGSGFVVAGAMAERKWNTIRKI
jgi:uncharacterized membrane protein